jgi:NADH-quinone oxidoreductase subunit H
MMWVRWTLPRLRIDQVMMLCLKYLIPISCILLVGVSVWTLFVPAEVQQFVAPTICVLSLIGLAFLVFQILNMAKAPPGTGMPGMWRMKGLPGYQGAAK